MPANLTMGQGPAAPAPSPAAAPAMAEATAPEITSVFIPKDVLGREVKPGETITLTVRDVDPETGEVEAVAGESTPKPTESRLNRAIDMMPEEEEAT